MIADDPKVPRAERFGAIVDLGFAAWAARWPLYVAIAAASVALELAAATAAHFDLLIGAIVLSCVDGFATALVTLDAFARFSNEPRTIGSLASAALIRWPVVFVTLIVAQFFSALVSPWMFGSAEDMLYGLLVLPALAVLGVLGIMSVIATLAQSVPGYATPGYAVLRSMLYAAELRNLVRLTIAGAMIAVPSMLQWMLEPWLAAHGFDEGRALFWANVPIDALSLAPFQAFFTYLYLDFTVREQRR